MSARATTESAASTGSPGSRVTMVAPAPAKVAFAHFQARLACEADPADVARDIADGTAEFTLVDCRPAGNYTKTHLPGAISLPWPEITEETVRALPDGLLVTYCWGPSCNAATKGAMLLAAHGRQVKELIGGIEYWIREGHPTEGRRPVQPGEEKPTDWGLTA
jgi:rhodanese-related sulfurtransferase